MILPHFPVRWGRVNLQGFRDVCSSRLLHCSGFHGSPSSGSDGEQLKAAYCRLQDPSLDPGLGNYMRPWATLLNVPLIIQLLKLVCVCGYRPKPHYKSAISVRLSNLHGLSKQSMGRLCGPRNPRWLLSGLLAQ